jgi:hypothetical protein
MIRNPDSKTETTQNCQCVRFGPQSTGKFTADFSLLGELSRRGCFSHQRLPLTSNTLNSMACRDDAVVVIISISCAASHCRRMTVV